MAVAGPAGARPRALVLRALGLGDLLTAVPALRGVRAALTGHEVALATPASLRPLVGLIGAVDTVVPVRGLAPLDRGAGPVDVAVNLHGRGPQSHRLLLALAPRRLVAVGCAEAGVDGPAWDPAEHEVARWCRLVEQGLGGRCAPDDLDLARPPVEPPVRGAAVVHPGAAHPSRRWPPDRFAAVARWLAEQDLPVVVSGSPAERPVAEAVARGAGLPVASVLAGRTSVLELAALVADARLVVCGDTGVAHLASAYRTASVVLFGPVSPALWGPPRRPQHVVLWHGRGDGDPWGAQTDPALLALQPAEVLAAVGRGWPAVVASPGGRGW